MSFFRRFLRRDEDSGDSSQPEPEPTGTEEPAAPDGTPEAKDYEFPGEYSQRFDSIDEGGSTIAPFGGFQGGVRVATGDIGSGEPEHPDFARVPTYDPTGAGGSGAEGPAEVSSEDTQAAGETNYFNGRLLSADDLKSEQSAVPQGEENISEDSARTAGTPADADPAGSSYNPHVTIDYVESSPAGSDEGPSSTGLRSDGELVQATSAGPSDSPPASGDSRDVEPSRPTGGGAQPTSEPGPGQTGGGAIPTEDPGPGDTGGGAVPTGDPGPGDTGGGAIPTGEPGPGDTGGGAQPTGEPDPWPGGGAKPERQDPDGLASASSGNSDASTVDTGSDDADEGAALVDLGAASPEMTPLGGGDLQADTLLDADDPSTEDELEDL